MPLPAREPLRDEVALPSHSSRHIFEFVNRSLASVVAAADDRDRQSVDMASATPLQMATMQLVGHGGFDGMHHATDGPIPAPHFGEVLTKVAAAGVNRTDIRRRMGAYGKTFGGLASTGGANGFDTVVDVELDNRVFENLISCIGRHGTGPLSRKTFPLSGVRRAQGECLDGAFVGKCDLVPAQ